MPMMPSPVAALTYGAVKIAGYALFAKVLNRYAQKPVSPLKFGLVKTAVGLIGGLGYLFLMYSLREDTSDAIAFIGALPVRLVVWAIVIEWFYGDGLERRTRVVATLAGTVWSYVLDGLMALIYRVLPGMVMPFC
jgi:hypothetical protein